MVELDHGRVVIAAITSCTNTSNPSVMVGAGLLARNAVERGLDAQALGEDLAGAGLDGGHRLPRERRPDRVPRPAPVQPRRLRLHHLHRQLRPAAAGDLGGGRGEGPGRSARCSRATATSRAGSTRTSRPTTWPARRWSSPTRSPAGWTSTSPASRSARAPTASRSTCATSGPSAEEIKEVVGALDRLGDVHPQLRRGASRATRTGTRSRCPRATATPGPTRPTCAARPSSRGCRPRRRGSSRSQAARVLALLGDSITTDHISPAGAIKKDSPAGPLADRAGRRAARLQLLRLAARQPRGDDPRHLRQHPPAQPPGRARRRLHPPLPRRRGDDDLRRGDGIRRRRRAAGRPRGQGVRLGLLARLGGEGDASCSACGR